MNYAYTLLKMRCQAAKLASFQSTDLVRRLVVGGGENLTIRLIVANKKSSPLDTDLDFNRV